MNTKLTHPLNKLFLTKLQEQIKQAPGYSPVDVSSLYKIARLMHNPDHNYRFIKR